MRRGSREVTSMLKVIQILLPWVLLALLPIALIPSSDVGQFHGWQVSLVLLTAVGLVELIRISRATTRLTEKRAEDTNN